MVHVCTQEGERKGGIRPACLVPFMVRIVRICKRTCASPHVCACTRPMLYHVPFACMASLLFAKAALWNMRKLKQHGHGRPDL